MMAGFLPSSLLRPEVVGASVRAVAELLSCCVLGVVAAKNGILNSVNVGALSKVRVWLGGCFHGAERWAGGKLRTLSVFLHLKKARCVAAASRHLLTAFPSSVENDDAWIERSCARINGTNRVTFVHHGVN